MILKICAVKDLAAELYARPMFFQHENLAARSFNNEINRKDDANPLYTNPTDFELYYLGTFDEETGEFKLESPPTRMLRGSELQRK
jgi:hypothetical protein